MLYLRNTKTGEMMEVEDAVVVSAENVERAKMRAACGFPAKGPLPAMPGEGEIAEWERAHDALVKVLDLPQNALGKTGAKNIEAVVNRLEMGVQGAKTMTQNGWTVEDFRSNDEDA